MGLSPVGRHQNRSVLCLRLLIHLGDTHPWIQRITGAMTQGALADCFRRFPLIAAVVLRCIPGTVQKVIADCKINERFSIDLVERRIAKKTDRKDFLTRILENRGDDISDIQIAAHASDFVLAGSETTATALSCITYYLFKTPHALRALREEIRSTFSSYEEINGTSTSHMQYLTAVALEGMRIYPPLPIALPRVVPEMGDTVNGEFLPAGVSGMSNTVRLMLIRWVIDYRFHKSDCCKFRSGELQ